MSIKKVNMVDVPVLVGAERAGAYLEIWMILGIYSETTVGKEEEYSQKA
jgi:hypothetical protein